MCGVVLIKFDPQRRAARRTFLGFGVRRLRRPSIHLEKQLLRVQPAGNTGFPCFAYIYREGVTSYVSGCDCSLPFRMYVRVVVHATRTLVVYCVVQDVRCISAQACPPQAHADLTPLCKEKT